jgi:hypothetical protein
MWRNFRNVAAAAVTKGRRRLRRAGLQASRPKPAAAPTEINDDPPTVATLTTLLDDTLPLKLRYDPVERVRTRRLAAANRPTPAASQAGRQCTAISSAAEWNPILFLRLIIIR